MQAGFNKTLNCSQIAVTNHVAMRIIERLIPWNDIVQVVETGEIVKEYPDDTPYPSKLMLKFIHGFPLHVVVSQNMHDLVCYIITAYYPDPLLWSTDFKTKK